MGVVSMVSHRSKNTYDNSSDAQEACERYTSTYGFVFRWYECDKCEYFHIATKRHYGVPVVSLDAIRKERG